MRNYKALPVLFVILLICTFGFGQKIHRQKVDTLYHQAILANAINEDTIRGYIQDIMAVSLQHNYEYGVVKAKLLSSLYYINHMRLDTAGILLKQCETFFETNNDLEATRENGFCNFLLGERAFRLMKFDSAEIYAMKSLAIYEKTGSEVETGKTLSQLGTIYQLKGNMPKALEFYLSALKMKMSASQNPNVYRREVIRIADIYVEIGQYEKALEYNRMALRGSASPRIRSENLKTIGDLYTNIGMTDSALYYYTLAKKELHNTNEQKYLKVIDYNIARVLSLMSKFTESNRLVFALLKDKFSAHSTMEGDVKSQLAINYLGLKKYDSAIYFARSAFRIFQKRQSTLEIAQNSNILSQSFKALRKYDSALHYSAIHHANKDSLFSMENQKKLSTLYAEIETLSKQKEIDALEKQAQIDKAQNRNLVLAIVLGSLTFLSLIFSLLLFFRNRQKKQLLRSMMLQQELDQKNKDLHEQTLKMIYMNNSFIEIEEGLRGLQTDSVNSVKDVRHVLSNLQINKTLEKEWENFNRYFGSVHGNFYDRISNDYPDLSISEMRLASLLRMNLTNREIAAILKIESASVKMAKYRLKKKLNLTDDVDIQSFFQTIN